MAPSSKTTPCPGGCDHTDREHKAFDRGVRDGEAGKDQHANPYNDSSLRGAWSAGQSVGESNRGVKP